MTSYEYQRIDRFCDLLCRHTSSVDSQQVRNAYYYKWSSSNFPGDIAEWVPQFPPQDLTYLWEHCQAPWVSDVVAYRGRFMELLSLADVHQFLYGSWTASDDIDEISSCPPSCACRSCTA